MEGWKRAVVTSIVRHQEVFSKHLEGATQTDCWNVLVPQVDAESGLNLLALNKCQQRVHRNTAPALAVARALKRRLETGTVVLGSCPTVYVERV